MLTRLRPGKPSPALVISCLALFVALSGSSYAVIVLPKGSVGNKQLRNNAVKSPKIANNQVTGADVNEATLGQVPSAGNAGLLDGSNSASFLRNGAVAGGRLGGTYPNPTIPANSLTGGDINESSLGQVPNASTLNGLSSSAFARSTVYRRTGSGAGSCVGDTCRQAISCDSPADIIVGGGYASVDNGTHVEAAYMFTVSGASDYFQVVWINNATPDTVEVAAHCLNQ